MKFFDCAAKWVTGGTVVMCQLNIYSSSNLQIVKIVTNYMIYDPNNYINIPKYINKNKYDMLTAFDFCFTISVITRF